MNRSSPSSAPRKAGKPPLAKRRLVAQSQADELVRVFKMLANEMRIRLLHALERAGEMCVTDLAAAVESAPQAVSNQLQRLVDRRVVTSRRDGTYVYYRIADPCVTGLLDLAWCLMEETDHLGTSKETQRRR